MSLADLRFLNKSSNDGNGECRLSDGLAMEDMPTHEPMRPRGVWRRKRGYADPKAIHNALRSRIGLPLNVVKAELDGKLGRRGRVVLQETIDGLPVAAYEIDGRIVVHYNRRTIWIDDISWCYARVYVDLDGNLAALPEANRSSGGRGFYRRLQDPDEVTFERNGKKYVARDGIWYREISQTRRWRQIVGAGPDGQPRLEDREDTKVTYRQLDSRRLRKLGISNV